MAETNNRLAPVFVSEEPRTFDENAHLYPPEYKGHFESLLLSADEIRARVRALAKLVHEDYKGKRPVLVCTLKGAAPFCVHFSDALIEHRHGFDLEFVRASSYAGTKSSGTVQVLGELNVESIRNRHVLIVEDIVDTGTTLQELVPMLQDKAQPASIQVVSLLDKRLNAEKKFTAKYTGFSIPNYFVIGYGLDYNELYRDLQDIFCISKAGIDFDASTLHA
jgi:hypoxanthine phosphoribosyltransferase